MSEERWHKSSRSSKANCVEVAVSLGGTRVRDTKDRAGGHVAVNAQRWQAFLGQLKAGRFDS